MIVTDERVALFVSKQLNVAFCPPFTTMGTERDGEIVNGVIFNVFEGNSINVSLAGSGWTRGFIRAVGDYAFTQLRCLRMTAVTRNADVISIAQRLGGQVEGRLRDHFGVGEDGIIIGILAREWKYR